MKAANIGVLSLSKNGLSFSVNEFIRSPLYSLVIIKLQDRLSTILTREGCTLGS
jgi:hypothetical protein